MKIVIICLLVSSSFLFGGPSRVPTQHELKNGYKKEGESSLIGKLSSIMNETDPKSKGKRLAKYLERVNDGFLGEESQVTMELHYPLGKNKTKRKPIIREFKSYVKEVSGDGDKSISIFQKPVDVKNTKILTWSHKNKIDDQWYYGSKTKLLTRIKGGNRRSSFLGSEFAYEDMGSQEPEKYDHVFLSESKEGGDEVWKLERKPREISSYSKVISYISKIYKNPVKAEYYNGRGEILKVASFEDWEKYVVEGKPIYRANKITMQNVQTGKKSILKWNKRILGKKVSGSRFKAESLRSGF